MASIVSLGNVLEVKAFLRQGAQTGINVSHWVMTGGAGASLYDDVVAGFFSTQLAPLYKAYMSQNVSYEGVKLQIIFPAPAKVAVISVAGAGVGALLAECLPPQTALLFTKTTALAGRSNRGRMYLPFWPETASDGIGVPTNAAQAQAAALATYYTQPHTFTVGADSTTLAPILWHKGTANYSLVTQAIVRGAWATQRRRSLINKADATFP